jgi:hypothetical protein
VQWLVSMLNGGYFGKRIYPEVILMKTQHECTRGFQQLTLFAIKIRNVNIPPGLKDDLP